MKKVISLILVAALSIAMIFSLSACNSDDAEFKANYKDCTKEQIATLNTNIDKADKLEIKDTSKGFHLYGSTKSDTNMQLSELLAEYDLGSVASLFPDGPIEMKMNSEVDLYVAKGEKFSASGEAKIDIQLNSETLPSSIKDLLSSQNVSGAYYYNEGKLYQKQTTALGDKETSDVVSEAKFFSSVQIDEFDISDMVEGVLDGVAEGTIPTDNVKIATTDECTKLKIIINEAMASATFGATATNILASGEIYVSLAKDYSLRGFKSDLNMSATIGSSNTSFSSKLTLVPFEGTVEVPDSLKSLVK